MELHNNRKFDIAFWTGYYDDDEDDYFEWASSKAYLDMNRTMTFSKSEKNEKEIAEERDAWRKQGTDIIRKRFKLINDNFDKWHKETCDELIAFYNEGDKLIERNTKNKTSLTYGQAQKWLNMTIKYIWLLDRFEQLNYDDHEIVAKYEEFFHIPLDSYILRYVARQNKSKTKKFDEKVSDNGLNIRIDFKDAWSKINDYSSYIEYQKTLCANLKDCKIPLEWELIHWHKALKYYG